jgi:hypothetical protein
MPCRDCGTRNYKEYLNTFAPPLAADPSLECGNRFKPPFLKGGGHVPLSLSFHFFLYCPYFLLTFFSMLCLYNRFKRLNIVPFYSLHSFNLPLAITYPGELKRETTFINRA